MVEPIVKMVEGSVVRTDLGIMDRAIAEGVDRGVLTEAAAGNVIEAVEMIGVVDLVAEMTDAMIRAGGNHRKSGH